MVMSIAFPPDACMFTPKFRAGGASSIHSPGFFGLRRLPHQQHGRQAKKKRNLLHESSPFNVNDYPVMVIDNTSKIVNDPLRDQRRCTARWV